MLLSDMFQTVLDTNVLAAAMLSSRGASHRLLRMLGDARWRLNLSVPLFLEYEQTLKRVCGARGCSTEDIERVLAFVSANARLRPIYFLWRPLLPDPADHMVLELAIESRSDYLITFNRRDFGPASEFGIRVVSPREFLAILEQE